MQVSIYMGHNQHYFKEVSELQELTPLEIGGATKSLFHDFQYIADKKERQYKNYNSGIEQQDLENAIIKQFQFIRDGIYDSIQLIIKEKHFPRDMTPETNWQNERVKKEPFILDETLEGIYKNLDYYTNEQALLKSANWVSESTLLVIQQQKEEIAQFVNAFKVMFSVINPEKSWDYCFIKSEQKSKEYVETFRNNKFTLTNKDIQVVFDAIWACDIDYLELGAKATAFQEDFDTEALLSLQKILEINNYMTNSDNNCILINMVSHFYKAYLQYSGSKEYIKRFKSFDTYFNRERNHILHDSGLYVTKDTIEKSLAKLESNKDAYHQKFLRETKRHQELVAEFNEKLHNWLKMFNAFFNETKNEQKIYRFQKNSDCDVMNYAGNNLVVFPLLNEYGIAEQYRGALLSDEQLKEALCLNTTLSNVLLDEWKILESNTKMIRSTSFHHLDNVLQDLNTSRTRGHIFENSQNDDCLFLAA